MTVEWHWLRCAVNLRERNVTLVLAILSELGWLWCHVLVWVEAAKSNISQTLDLKNGHWWLLSWRGEVGSFLVVSEVTIGLLLLIVLEFLRHWWQSDSFWEVWQGVNQFSLFLLRMIERASFTKLALTSLIPVLAWLGLVIGVNSSKCCLSEVLGKRL